MWKKVGIKVEDHIKIVSFPEDLTTENYSKHFDNYLSQIATLELPRHQPLWELHIINCPQGHPSAAGVIVFKIHHAIGDGTSLMGMVLSCFRRVDDPSLPLTILAKPPTVSKNEHSVANTMINIFKIVPKFIFSVMYSLLDVGQSVRLAFFEDTKTSIRSGNTDMTRPFSSRICSLDLPLNDVKRIKTILGVTVNDIIIGIIFYGTRLYIQETQKGSLKNARATATVVVDIRNGKQRALNLEGIHKEKAWGNRIAIMALPLPNFEDDNLTDPLEYIHKIHKIVKARRSGVYGPFLMGGLLSAIKTVAGIQTAARTFERIWKNSSFGITNVIGPREKVSIGNHPVNGLYFVPTGVNTSLSFSVMSYMENLKLGLVVENDFIDHQKLLSCLEKSFQLIFQAAQSTSNYFAP